MFKKLIFISLMLLISVSVSAQKKIAIYVTGDDPVNDIIASRLLEGLTRNGKYIPVERTAAFLNALSKEHSYERDGAVDDNEIASLGKQFSVQYVCVASILSVWNNEKYITARIIDVETAEVVASGSSSGSITSSPELISALNKLSDNFLKALDYNKTSRASKVAVYVTKTGNRDVDIILADQLVAGFAHSGKYIAIERTQSFLSQISKEQGYQYSGAVDDDDLTRLGKQFGVQYVCVAKTTSWSGDYYINARLIDVATAEIVNTYSVEGIKLSTSQSVVNVATNIAAKLSGITFKEEREMKEAEERRIEQERLEQERQKQEAEQRRKETEQRRKEREEQLRKDCDKVRNDGLYDSDIPIYREAFKQWDGKFNTAKPEMISAWRKVFLNCPCCKERTLVDGTKIVKALISGAKNTSIKETYIDTLEMVYETRLLYFPTDKNGNNQIGNIKGRLGLDLMAYPSRMEHSYNALKEAVEIEGNNTNAAFIDGLMTQTITMVKAGKLNKSVISKTYLDLKKIVDYNISKYSANGNTKLFDTYHAAGNNLENMMDSNSY